MTGDREADDWETIWMETKVDLIDTFHIILTTTLKDISSSSGPTLAREAECAFDIIFSLLDLSSSSIPFSHSAPSGTLPPITPFLNRSLLADYQQAYSLSQTLTSVLHHAAEKDARIDLLESSLRSLESNLSESGADSGKGHKDAGGLKLLLRSSGVPPGVDHRGHRKGKGKAHPAIPPVPATVVPSSDLDPDLEDKVNQVLDIFPDHSRAYIRALLVHPVYPFRGSAEGVVGALLEGTAPGYDVMGAVEEVSGMQGSIAEEKEEDAYTMERKNVWDEDVMNLNNVHVGKKMYVCIPLSPACIFS
jgi:activating signal cointegrator complex subunit 2